MELSNRRLTSLLECSSDFIFEVNPQGTLTFVSRPAPGFTKEEMVGSDILRWMEEKNHHKFKIAFAKAVSSGKTTSYDAIGSVTGRQYENLIKPMFHNGKAEYLAIVARDVTDIKESQRFVKESEERFRLLSEATFEGIVISDSKNGIIQDCNRAFAEMFGYERSEVLNKTPAEFIVDKYVAKAVGHMKSGYELPYEIEGVRKDGTIITIEVRGRHHKVADKLLRITVIRDVTRCVVSEKALQEAENRDRQYLLEKAYVKQQHLDTLELNKKILASTHIGVIAYRADTGQCIIANPASATIVGATQEQLLAQNFRKITSWQKAGLLQAAEKALATGEDQQIEVNVVSSFKKSLWLNSFFSSFTSQNIKHLLIIIADVTSRKLAEQSLLLAKEDAVAANRAKSEFLAVMSHEIRTPLNAILGMGEVASEFNQDPDLSRCIDVINRSSKNLQTLIEDILDLSQIESGRLNLEHKPIDIKELTQEALDIHNQNAKSKWLSLTCNITPDTPKQFEGDKRRIRQVLLNLIGNAIKFTEQGKIELIVSYPSSENILFSVVDSGIGIPDEKQKLIFEPFSQADSSNTRQHGGIGLGLSICKRLIDAMNGKLWVQSVENQGSTFYFYIPLSKNDKNQLENKNISPQHKNETVNKPRTILLVEDNRDNAIVIEAYLSNTIHNLEIVEDGLQAVEKIKSGKKYDLILMDIQMPLMDGLEATQKIRQWEKDKKQPKNTIMALSAHAMLGDEAKSLSAGCDSHITKPISKKKLLELIDKSSKKTET
ncbi:MAG: PAS domain S-box protein [Magnetococcales bacterium]|nr:PAS domain S-box protein [Magnetococcales bacterium]